MEVDEPMRIANVAGRASLLVDDGAVDIAGASGGRFSPDPQSLYDNWDAFRIWAATLGSASTTPYDPSDLGPPVPRPGQVFGIGFNYRDHAVETNFELPADPLTFTKFPSCITGPNGVVALSGDQVDWEVELVIVIGRDAHRVPSADGWSVVAGVTVGQDISDRYMQFRPPTPQFSLGKSFPGYGPIGPVVVTPEALADRDDLELGCTLNGQLMQKGRTSDMVFSVPELIARLSTVVTLRPGDLIFTGTPAGIGLGRKPPVWLQPGDELRSFVTGVGEMVHNFR
ncbi:MAG: hypothetical protein QOF53_1142 [Nocardioidaceae bacterium]|jgi:2,4-diketo-3-deoxy-L-fuconate hydrolase|nr:hypothetical protein [Nocardioidaceae bacterium]